jgi:diguanylate cyclase (GGDEF)-like protein/PAS domain S-box-containing protein
MENMSKKQKRAWIVVLAVYSFIIVLFPLVFSQSITSDFKQYMAQQRQNSVSKMVHLAYNAVEPLVDQLKQGEISQDEARRKISDLVREMTYADEFGPNYIFMSTYDGTMLVQPYEPQKEGTDQWLLQDARGRYIIQELVNAAKAKPEGSFVTYDYYLPNRSTVEEKLSFVIGIPEINAYIGTGMYIESTYRMLEAILERQRTGYLAMTVFILVSLLIYARILLRSNQRLQREIQERTYAENNLRTVFDTIHETIMIHDETGKILHANNQAGIMYGLRREDMLDYELADISADSALAKQWLEKVDERIEDQGFMIFEWKAKRPVEGTVLDVEVALRKTKWSGKNAYVAAIRDITERKQFTEKLQNQYQELKNTQKELQEKHDELAAIYEELAATEEELRNQYRELQNSQEETTELADRYISISEGTNDVIWYWDTRKGQIRISDRLKELLGYSAAEIDMQYDTLLAMMHFEDQESFQKNYEAHLEGKTEFFLSEYRVKTRDGEYKWFMSRGKAVVDEEGNLARSAGSITDITERKQYMEKIHHLAYYDSLTGLPNRAYIMNELQERLDPCAAGSGSAFFIDVDNFKVINDTHGHSFGDRMLVEIARRLDALTSQHLTPSRLGGDEFLVLSANTAGNAEVLELGDIILALFKEAVSIDNVSFHITCSIGVAVYPRDGQTVEEILKHADLAMYKAKSLGRDKYVLYDSSMIAELSQRTELENHLREAYKNREFLLHYQPQVAAESGRIVGIEALIRWNSTSYGLVFPGKFIPVAEEMGLINEIGKWVIESSFAFARSLMHKEICVSCNVSSVQLKQSSFVEDVIEVFDRLGLQKGSVALEITESCLVESFDDTYAKLAKLRARGIMIYLDDFGTGYSSLNYMKSLPIDVLKIDKSFINNITADGIEKQIVKTIVSLAREIGLKVVAEGVETKEQQAYLTDCGCHVIQGYLFSRPVPEAEILGLM